MAAADLYSEPKTASKDVHSCKNIHTVYLAGKMRGVEKYNHPLFDDQAALYRRLGFTVISPAEMDREVGMIPDALPQPHNWDIFPQNLSKTQVVSSCLWHVMHKADAIFLLSGWETSCGTCAEIAVAMWLDKPVFENIRGTSHLEVQPKRLRAHQLTFEEFIARVHKANYPTGDITVSYDGALLGHLTPESTKLLQQKLHDSWRKPAGNDNRNQPTNNSTTTKFSTGAVRSSDRDKERYDLISPIGVRRVVALLDKVDVCSHKLNRNSSHSCLPVIEQLYTYLAGNRHILLVDTNCLHILLEILPCVAYATMSRIAKRNLQPGEPYSSGGVLQHGMAALARVCHEGAEKYSDYNWEKGMPVSDILNHAIAHLLKHDAGDTSEDHLGHALWNIFAAMHSEEMWPELNKNLRLPGCKPPVEKA